MSHPDNSPPPPIVASQQPGPADPTPITHSLPRLVHELANLLDGSLRNVLMAIGDLKGSTPDKAMYLGQSAEPLDRLQAAGYAMQQMASLIRHWQQHHKHTPSPAWGPSSLGLAAQHAAVLVGPDATKHAIEIRVELPDHLAGLPAGPAYTILTNALRNSVQAIVSTDLLEPSDGAGGWWIEIQAQAVGRSLELCVRDNGPGLHPTIVDAQGQLRLGQSTKPNGHGIGLCLIHDITNALGGSVSLRNRTPHGAQLTARYPLDEAFTR